MRWFLVWISLISTIGVSNALEFEQFSLKNGMNVVVIPDHRAPVVMHSVWYQAGSMDEQEGRSGIAHMLEHMMFKGTKAHPDGEFDQIVSRHGGQDNAFTSRDYTAYYQKVAKEKLPLMMELEADRMANLDINDTVFQPERDVVMEERRWRTDSKPTDRFFEKLVRQHYQEHTYGRPVIGWQRDIEAYTVEKAIDWYQTYYAPNNATMILAGDVTMAEVKPMVEKYYGDVEVKQTPARAAQVEPLRDGPVRVEEVDKDVQVPVFYQIYRAPSAFQGVAGAPTSLPEVVALMVLAEVFGGSETGWLYKALVEEQQIADAASADYDAVAAGESSVDVFVQPKPGITLAVVEAAVQAQITKLQEQGVSQAEFDRVKTGLIADDVYARDDLFYGVYRMGVYLMAGGTPEKFDDWKAVLNALTPADIQAVAQKYLAQEHSTTGLLVGSAAQFGKDAR